ncbi:MAG: ABC-type transport auxiliary lipoprotein family protein [Stappiaceae bacterium]
MAGIRKHKRLAFGLVAGCLAIALSGCIGGGSSAPKAIFDLSAPVNPDIRHRSNAQILIPKPRAIQALNTSNIAVVSDGNEISYFPKVVWSDELPNLVQANLVETFENSGRVKAVGLPGEGLLINYQISTEIRAFQLDVNGGRRAIVSIAAKIINDRNGRAVATETFRAEVAVPTDQPAAAVIGMNSAANQVFTDLVAWVLRRT